MGIILGGIVPAIIFGVALIFIKASSQEKICSSYHLLSVAVGLIISSGVAFFIFQDKNFSVKGGLYSLLYGLGLGAGLIFLSISLTKYHTPMAVLSPLYSMSTLVTVLLSLWLFAEWKDLNVIKLISGTVIILIGGYLVGSS